MPSTRRRSAGDVRRRRGRESVDEAHLLPRREDAIAKALQKKLEQRRAMREANAEAFRKEIEEFTANFLNAAREAFALIDKDDSGSLSKTEIVRAVREDRPVIDFLRNCGEENLQFLLQPAVGQEEGQVARWRRDRGDVTKTTGYFLYHYGVHTPLALAWWAIKWYGLVFAATLFMT